MTTGKTGSADDHTTCEECFWHQHHSCTSLWGSAVDSDARGWLTLALQLRGRHAATCPKARRSPKHRSALHPHPHHRPAAETDKLGKRLHSNRSCPPPTGSSAVMVFMPRCTMKGFFFSHVWNSKRAVQHTVLINTRQIHSPKWHLGVTNCSDYFPAKWSDKSKKWLVLLHFI